MKKIVLLLLALLLIASFCLSVSADSKYNWSLNPTPTPRPYKNNRVTWRCSDATSYDGNAYNDNKCVSSTGQVKYCSDSEAKALDPSYRPGKSGAWYYNNK